MTTKEQLEQSVKDSKDALAAAEKALADFETSPENNVFSSVEEAEGVIEDRLMGQAHEDCEGSHNCGLDEYTQEFIVGDMHYIATLKCEYNRHDKTYYYVDGHEFTVAPK